MKKLLLNAYIFIFVIFSNSTFSEDTEEVIVVASAIIDSSEITNPLYVIDGDDIIDDATTSLGEAVDSYLGVSIADYGAAIGQPIIRGMSGSRVKILKNGMVNRDVSGLGADHLNDVDFNDLKQLEIVKGPSSLLYANGTIGGIINVVDECIAPEDYLLPKFNAGFETQSVNNGDSQYINYGNNISGFNINIGYKESNFGNYDIPLDAVIHDGEEDHDEEELSYIENSDLASEAFKIGVSKVGDWGYVGVSFDNLESVYGIPFHGEEHEGDDHGEERIFSSTDSESLTIKGSLNSSLSLINKIDFNYRDSDYSLTEAHEEEDHGDDDHGDDEHAPTVFMNDATEFSTIFDISGDNATQKISLNFVDEENSIVGEEAFMNPVKSDEFTVGYFLSKKFDLVSLDLGVRFDQIDRDGSVSHEDGDLDHYSISDDVTSYALSLGRSINSNIDINLGFASVERLPSAVELFMNGPHMATGRFEVGDPTLKSETSENIDLSFNYETDNTYAFLSLYFNDVDNYIALIDEDDHGDDDHGDDDHGDDDHGDDDHGDDDHGDGHGHGDHENLIHANYMQENASFDGYEMEIGRTISLAGGELNVSFGKDAVKAKFSDGHYVPRINPGRNIYSLSYNKIDTVFKLSLKDVSSQYDIAEGETVTNGYQMLDARITKEFNLNDKSSLKISFFGRNLLNESARNHSSFVKDPVPLPGRNYGVKFNLTY